MAALKLVVLLALVAVCFAQFGFNPLGGYYGQGAGFGQAGGFGMGMGPGMGMGMAPGFGIGRQPMGFQTTATYAGGPVGAPVLGYDPFYSNIQRHQIYAQNLGYDQTSAAGANCVNGMRGFDGLCQCAAGWKGADCNTPLADIALNQEAGVVCQQTAGDAAATAAEEAKYQSEPTGQYKRNLQMLMAYAGQPQSNALLVGPGIGTFCPRVPNRGQMAPVHMKSAITDYGYVVCSENQLCYNKVCPACTMFNPRSGVCDNIANANARGLPLCNVVAGETPMQVKMGWYQAALSTPKLSAEGGQLAPNAAVAGNAFIGSNPFIGGSPAPYGRPFYG